MMRDSRGRFISDREHAATVLLEAALADAQKELAASLADISVGADPLTMALDRELVAADLMDACRWADLLLAGDR